MSSNSGNNGKKWTQVVENTAAFKKKKKNRNTASVSSFGYKKPEIEEEITGLPGTGTPLDQPVEDTLSPSKIEYSKPPKPPQKLTK